MSKGHSYLYAGTKGHIVSIAHSLPENPLDLLREGWEDISHPAEKSNGSMVLREKLTGLKIRFDEAKPDGNGYAGKDHYHIFNPNTVSRRDRYLDINGNAVAKGSSASHILPKEEK